MNRRRYLLTTAAAAGAAALARDFIHDQTATPSPSLRIIDTHTHFYDPTRPQGVPWPAQKDAWLYRKVMPSDWLALASPHGIRETVVVEASPWVEDNQWILDLAEKEKCIVGFVGNLDPNDTSFTTNLQRFAQNPIFRGIRWRGDLVRIDTHKDKVLTGAKLLAQQGLSLDLNGPPTMLPHAAQLAAHISDLRIVINHTGGAGDPKTLHPEWKDHIRSVAKQPNVFMKVSAVVEQAKATHGQAPQDTAYYLPILDHLWECFGPDRLIYGSNWPVSDKGASYNVVFKIVNEYFGSKGPEASEKYFCNNSKKAYRWLESP